MKWPYLWGLGLCGLVAATAAPPAVQPAAPAEISADTLYETGKDLFDALAPAELKAQFDFPDRAQWEAFAVRLQAALDGTDPAALARLEPELRTAVATLRTIPEAEEYIGWLEERLEYSEVAREMGRTPARPPATKSRVQFIPNYDLWQRRLQTRARPAAAGKYVPLLQPVFVAGAIPGGLVWLAEVESGFNPLARSPAGARGLFQLMPATARELGLRTTLPDERTDPRKSAQGAARMLHDLHAKFGDWPLALAAYNAGSGRVQRTLQAKRATTFAQIAADLPVETRMYVPKVLAVLQVRTGTMLAGPGRP